MSAAERRPYPTTHEFERQSRCSTYERPVWPLNGSVEVDVSAAIGALRARAAKIRHFRCGLIAVIGAERG